MQRTRRTMLQLLASLPLLAAAANERQSPPPITRNSGKGVEGIRGLLPQLAAGDGSELAYLDSAATSLRPRPVLDAMREFYELQNANPARGLHSAATRAADAFDAARSRIARFIHTADPLEIIWTRGTTEGLNLVASAWGAAHLKPGDEILLTVAEHASNMLPWQLVAKKTRATVRYMEINDEGIWISMRWTGCSPDARSSSVLRMCPTCWARSIRRARSAGGQRRWVRGSW